MAQEFNIAQAYAEAFGLKFVPVTFPEAKTAAQQESPEVSFSGIETVSKEEAIQRSHLGTPIMFPVVLKGGVYHIYTRSGQVGQEILKDFRLPLSTLVSFSRKKVKNITRVVASQASVKEMYGHEDWQIRIRGFCLSDPGHPQGAETPIQQHNRLLEFENLADSIEIEGELFREKSIYRIDIDSINIDQLQAKPGMIPFSLNCTSDDPLELIVNG